MAKRKKKQNLKKKQRYQRQMKARDAYMQKQWQEHERKYPTEFLKAFHYDNRLVTGIFDSVIFLAMLLITAFTGVLMYEYEEYELFFLIAGVLSIMGVCSLIEFPWVISIIPFTKKGTFKLSNTSLNFYLPNTQKTIPFTDIKAITTNTYSYNTIFRIASFKIILKDNSSLTFRKSGRLYPDNKIDDILTIIYAITLNLPKQFQQEQETDTKLSKKHYLLMASIAVLSTLVTIILTNKYPRDIEIILFFWVFIPVMSCWTIWYIVSIEHLQQPNVYNNVDID